MALFASADSRMPPSDPSKKQNDEKGRNVEAEVPAGLVDHSCRPDPASRRASKRARSNMVSGMKAEPVEQIDNMGGKTHADRHVRAGVLQDQVPADDPGDELAQSGVGVSVGRAGDGNHRGQLGIAEARQARRQWPPAPWRARWAGPAPGRPASAVWVMMKWSQRRIRDAGRGAQKLAGDSRADDGENARGNDGADAESGQRPRPKRLLERRCSGSFESRISLSIDLRASSWFAKFRL